MNRKLLAYAPMLVLSLALTACGSNEAASTENQAASENTVENQVSTETKGNETAGTEDEDAALVYGTASLTYSEFYAGDVTSIDGFDAVSSATSSKYSVMSNMYTDFVDETANASGYHILGVANVAVAINENDVEAYKEINPTFELTEGETPKQYKLVTVEDGAASYSETVFNVAAVVTDATAELQTGTTWGDYQINVTDGAEVYLRNTRDDEGFSINSAIQGIILETESGLKVGMEYLQSIWVQPYEVSFNVPSDNTHNTHIAGYDNLSELSKLVGETVVTITYIMPTETYVYEFEGIYIKPSYEGEFTSTLENDTITIAPEDFSELENARLTVTYTVGSGRTAEKYELYNGAVEGAEYKLDTTEIAALETKDGKYSAILASDNFADISIPVPASEAQIESLHALIAAANEKLAADSSNETLKAHMEEAQELIDTGASSAEIASITSELTTLTADEQAQKGKN